MGTACPESTQRPAAPSRTPHTPSAPATPSASFRAPRAPLANELPVRQLTFAEPLPSFSSTRLQHPVADEFSLMEDGLLPPRKEDA